VDFSDLVGVPYADSTGTNLVHGLAAFYSEMSYGKTTFSPLGGGSDQTPTFRMPQPAAYYGTNNAYDQLRSDARNVGDTRLSSTLKSGAAQGSVFTTYNSLALEEAGFKRLAALETPKFPFPPATFMTRREIAAPVPADDAERPVEILRTIHSFDPCMACAVHVHDPVGGSDVEIQVV